MLKTDRMAKTVPVQATARRRVQVTTMLLRVRFLTDKTDRGPSIQPTGYPAQCTGLGSSATYNVWMAVVESLDQLLQLWPTAKDITVVNHVS